MPDYHGYPTKEELEQVRKYAYHQDFFGNKEISMDINKLIELLQEIWYYPDYVRRDGRNLELHTGGWSGNEEIIDVLTQSLFWLMYWQKSERGGHYYFELPKEWENK